MSQYHRIRSIRKKAREKESATVDDDHMSMSEDVIVDVTKRLLDINKGMDPDERDAFHFKRVLSPDKLLRERVSMDSNKVALNLMRKVNKTKSLKSILPNAFDPYMESLLLGNALSSPMEETNPLNMVEQQRRITQMGPGGLSSEDVISLDMQNIHPSEFGFLDSVSGPESRRIGVDTRAAYRAKLGSDGLVYNRYFDRRRKRFVWLSAKDMQGKVVGLPE